MPEVVEDEFETMFSFYEKNEEEKKEENNKYKRYKFGLEFTDIKP
jgi:hypothetical protein